VSSEEDVGGSDESEFERALDELAAQYRALGTSGSDPPDVPAEMLARLAEIVYPKAAQLVASRVRRRLGDSAAAELAEDWTQLVMSRCYARQKVAQQVLCARLPAHYCIKVMTHPLYGAITKLLNSRAKVHHEPLIADSERFAREADPAQDPEREALSAVEREEDLTARAAAIARMKIDLDEGRGICAHHWRKNAGDHVLTLRVLDDAAPDDTRKELLDRVRIVAGLRPGDMRLTRRFSRCLDWFGFRLTEHLEDDDLRRLAAVRRVAEVVSPGPTGEINDDRCSLSAACRIWQCFPLVQRVIHALLAMRVDADELEHEARDTFERTLGEGRVDEC
jgi:hypothetical protein